MAIQTDPFYTAVRLERFNYVKDRLEISYFSFDLLLEAIKNHPGFFSRLTGEVQAVISSNRLIGTWTKIPCWDRILLSYL